MTTVSIMVLAPSISRRSVAWRINEQAKHWFRCPGTKHMPLKLIAARKRCKDESDE
jgi:hypothetical protein